MKKPLGFIRLMRPINCLMMGIAVIVGASIAGTNSLNSKWPNLIYGFITGFMLTAASMTINDYYDRQIDSINEPNRPIPSGLIKPKEALSFALALTITGFAAAYLTGTFSLATAMLAWIVFVIYTTVGKRSGLPGNLLVSICVAIPFIYGSIAIANEVKLNVVIFASIAFLSNTGREITKGIVDIKGDETRNVKTLAVRYGDKTAAFAAAAFYLLSVLLSPTPWLLNLVSFWFIPLVAITDVGLVASSFMLVKDHSRDNARRIKKTVLLWFAIALVAFVVGTAR
jgi:geranylgeranylglycerol-phosphate geranylgeranyltransferase